MDIKLPGISGIECVAHLKRALPSRQIIMLTVYEDSERIFRALKAGADGYLVKSSPPEVLLEAIDNVHRGGSPISSHIARKVVRHFQLALQFGQTCPDHGWKLRCVRAPGIPENGKACPSPLSGIVSFRGVG